MSPKSHAPPKIVIQYLCSTLNDGTHKHFANTVSLLP